LHCTDDSATPTVASEKVETTRERTLEYGAAFVPRTVTLDAPVVAPLTGSALLTSGKSREKAAERLPTRAAAVTPIVCTGEDPKKVLQRTELSAVHTVASVALPRSRPPQL
jgi:hypothetical protein